MWHDQGEWVTCRQYSILIFQFKSLIHLKCYMLIQTPSQSDIWLQRYEQFLKFKNNVKHKNLSSLLACYHFFYPILYWYFMWIMARFPSFIYAAGLWWPSLVHTATRTGSLSANQCMLCDDEFWSTWSNHLQATPPSGNKGRLRNTP